MGLFCARSKRPPYTGSDVVGGSKEDSVMMAEKRAKKGAKNYCATGGPNKVNCSNQTGTPGISMYYFPKEESLRQKWTRFVRINRDDFRAEEVVMLHCLCSAHFDDSCFEHKSVSLADATGEARVWRSYWVEETSNKRFSTNKDCCCALYVSFDWPKAAKSKWSLLMLNSFHLRNLETKMPSKKQEGWASKKGWASNKKVELQTHMYVLR